MKITLINATKTGDIIPPLGLLSIAGYLLASEVLSSENVQILDVNRADPLRELKSFNPDLIGISAMTTAYPEAVKLAKRIKGMNPTVPIVIGGVHISTAPWSLSKVFSFGVIGEAEGTFLEVAEYLKLNGDFNDKSNLSDIAGIVFWDKERLIQTAERPLVSELDKLPPLNWQILPTDYFKPRGWIINGKFQAVPTGHLLTSRGCPYKCVFCSTSAFWRRARFFSAERVALEIERLYCDYAISIFQLWDDLFSVSKDRMSKIIKSLKEKGLLGKLLFTVQARSNVIDERMCELFKELGVLSVGFGFESGSDKVLQFLKKGSTTVEQNRQAVILLDKYDIEISGSFMFGSPDETVQDMNKTLDFMRWMRGFDNVSKIWHGVTTPFPGTELWSIALEQGTVSPDMNWGKLDIFHTRYSKASPSLYFHGSISKKDFSRIWFNADEIVKSIENRRKNKYPVAFAAAEEYDMGPIINRFKSFTFQQKISKVLYKPAKAIRILRNMLSDRFWGKRDARV
jgi:radical SAM superfamily enzyme YgiQ (UPF0313 family)